jgi:hypothetical protein
MDDEDGCTSDCEAEFCGDGVKQEYLGEECDGADFGGDDCKDYGFDGGTLKCSQNCEANADQCIGVCAAPGGGCQENSDCCSDVCAANTCD